jgi:hypothetical protein
MLGVGEGMMMVRMMRMRKKRNSYGARVRLSQLG